MFVANSRISIGVGVDQVVTTGSRVMIEYGRESGVVIGGRCAGSGFAVRNSAPGTAVPFRGSGI